MHERDVKDRRLLLCHSTKGMIADLISIRRSRYRACCVRGIIMRSWLSTLILNIVAGLDSTRPGSILVFSRGRTRAQCEI